METFTQDADGDDGSGERRSRSRTRSPASVPGSELCQRDRRRWSTRSRSIGKLQEWGTYAEHICAERQLRREQQALLEAALPHLQAQKKCPLCVTRGCLDDWERWVDNISMEAQTVEGSGWLGPYQGNYGPPHSGIEGDWQYGSEGGSCPQNWPPSGLRRLPTSAPGGGGGGGGYEMHQRR